MTRLPSQRAVLVELLAWLRPRGAPDDLAAVGAEEGAAVVAGRVGQPAHVFAVRIHTVQLEISVANRGEDDRAVLRADSALRIVSGRLGEPSHVAAVRGGAEDVVVLVECPHVALAHVGPRRTGICAQVGRGVDQLAIARQEMRAGGRPSAAGDLHWRPALGAHSIDSVALFARPACLKRKLRAVEGPVRFGVLPAVGQAAKVGKVDLLWERARRLLGAGAGGSDGAEQGNEGVSHPGNLSPAR